MFPGSVDLQLSRISKRAFKMGSTFSNFRRSDQEPEIHIREKSITSRSDNLFPEMKGRQDANAPAIYF